jgi:hypothetical protein
MAAGLWDVRIIYMIRDGRGMCNSFMKHYNAPMPAAVEEWRRTHAECAALRLRAPAERWLVLKYEDLCRQPDTELQRVFAFLGVDPRATRQDLRGMTHHILGNAMRLQNTSEIRLDEKWRTELSPADLAQFERAGGALNRSLGYE